MEGESGSAPVGTDADVAVEKVISRLGVLYWTFASAGHPYFLMNISWPLCSAYVIITEN